MTNCRKWVDRALSKLCATTDMVTVVLCVYTQLRGLSVDVIRYRQTVWWSADTSVSALSLTVGCNNTQSLIYRKGTLMGLNVTIHLKNNHPLTVNDLIYRLRKRAEIRRQIPGRKATEEGKPDRLADLLDEAANEIERLEKCILTL